MLKTCWFSLICLLFCILRVVISFPEFSVARTTTLAPAIAAVIVAAFQRKIAAGSTWKYSEKYAKFRVFRAQFVLSIVAVIWSILL